MKHFVYRFFIFTVCLSAIFTLSVAAQTVTGSLVGHVEDIAGATVPGARVMITEVNRGTSREITTNEEGNYSIGSLDLGGLAVLLHHRLGDLASNRQLELHPRCSPTRAS
jgi:hypothetical protein